MSILENFKETKTLPQYFFERDLFVEMFKEHAPLFEDYMWEQGGYSFFLENFIMIRDDDEFYLMHKDSGLVINWYKHLGRTNTCNKDITVDIFIEVLKELNSDIKIELGIMGS